jgi:hydrogenase small subunit
MPGFPDKFMPFMDPPPGAAVSSAASGIYGLVIRSLRSITQHTVNKEPRWRHGRSELTTGYQPTHYGNR